MTALNKQALREAAIRAGGGNWIYIRTLSLSNAYITEETGATVINCTAGDVPAKCAGFLELANPATVLTLLDEMEAAEHTAAVDHEAACSLVEENEEVKCKLAAAEKRNAELERRLSQQQSIAYHNLDLFNRADKQCRLVEKMLAERNAENEGLMLTVGRLRVEKESAEKRIADLDGHKRLIGWRASDYTDETSDPDLAKNWAAAIGVLPIFEGDVNTKLSAAGIGKGE